MIGALAALMLGAAQPAPPPGQACARSLRAMYTPVRVAQICAGVGSDVCYVAASRMLTFQRAADLCRHVRSDACMRAAGAYYTLHWSADICRQVDEVCFAETHRWTTLNGAAQRCRIGNP